jgi:tetrapyrrole methylase family protein/MazG family protein
VVARLRAPGGCPWDIEQTPQSIRHYILEEAHELVEAIEGGNPEEFRGEIGDVLFQMIFLARMAEDGGDFDLCDVADAVTEKLVRRHPHVFGSASAADSGAVERNWEKIKLREKGVAKRSVSEGIPRTTPALTRAYRIGERAARRRFDWPDVDGVIGKLREEIGELEVEIARLRAAAADGTGTEPVQKALEHELGDVLFSAANIGRRLGVEPELALQRCCERFARRYDNMCDTLEKRHIKLEDLPIKEMDEAWEISKKNCD